MIVIKSTPLTTIQQSSQSQTSVQIASQQSQQQQQQPIILSSYEEPGDDSIVPSTPTLYVPRRADGFSEAVSSPQPHVRIEQRHLEMTLTQLCLHKCFYNCCNSIQIIASRWTSADRRPFYIC